MKNLKKFLFILFIPLIFGFTYTWDVSTPAGTDDPTEGDDRIREIKSAFVERFDVDHRIPAVGNTYDGGTVGYHDKLTMYEQASDPSNVGSTIIFYTKDDGSSPAAYFIDENGTVKQWVSGTNLLLLLTEGSDVATGASQGAVYTKDSGTQPELYYREESSGDVVQITSNGALNVSENKLLDGWCSFDGSAGSPACDDHYNVSSITDNGNGDYTIVWDTDFTAATYAVMGMAREGSALNTSMDVSISDEAGAYATTGVRIMVRAQATTATNADVITVAAIGDHA